MSCQLAAGVASNFEHFRAALPVNADAASEIPGGFKFGEVMDIGTSAHVVHAVPSRKSLVGSSLSLGKRW